MGVESIYVTTCTRKGDDRALPPHENRAQQPVQPINIQVHSQHTRVAIIIWNQLEQQLRLTPNKLSLWDLLQQYKSYKESLNDILKSIDIFSEDPNAFMDFCTLVQDYTRPSITFYMDEIYHSLGSSCKYHKNKLY